MQRKSRSGRIDTRLAVVLLLVGSSATCRKMATERVVHGSSSTASSALPPLVLSGSITGRVTIEPHRTVVITDDVIVKIGGQLELGPGSVVRVSRGKILLVNGGQLIARGNSKDVVRFTSAAEHPRPGDWVGVVVDTNDLPAHRGSRWPTSIMEHVLVEFAGGPQTAETRHDLAGGVVLSGYSGFVDGESSASGLDLTNVEIRDCAVRGLDAQSDARVVWKDLHFGANGGVSARVSMELVVALGKAPTEAVELSGTLRSSLTLPALPYPYVVASSLRVGSFKKDTPAILTIPPGTVLKFRKSAGIRIGGHGYGGLTANRATFTSAENPAAPGDWSGISIWVNASVDLDGSTVEFAGADGLPALDYGAAESDVKIRGTVFRNNGGPAIGAPRSCKRWNDASLANSPDGQPICVTWPNRR